MGCDIHMYPEIKKHNRWWGFGRMILPRSYQVFGALAGVRGGEPLIKPKGMPHDISLRTRQDWCLNVTENEKLAKLNPGYAHVERAHIWTERGYSEWVGQDHRKITSPDWHTPTWLRPLAYGLALDKAEAAFSSEGMGVLIDYRALQSFLMRLIEDGADAPVVLWFDN